jgi:hypothetical protein
MNGLLISIIQIIFIPNGISIILQQPIQIEVAIDQTAATELAKHLIPYGVKVISSNIMQNHDICAIDLNF